MAFEGPGGDALMAWCVQNGHIHSELGENPTELVEHNLVKRLFHEAGVKVLPIIPRTINDIEAPKTEQNIIDETLEGDL